MGERAAQRTNRTLERLSGMYVSKNHGYSQRQAEAHDRIFAGDSRAPPASASEAARAAAGTKRKDVLFGRGPLGMEIVWSDPPEVVACVAGGAAHRAGVEVGDVILEINGSGVSRVAEYELDDTVKQRPLRLLLVPASAKPEPATAAGAILAAVVRRQGVSVVPGVLPREACSELVAFILEERARATAAAEGDPTVASGLFSPVQTPRAARDAPVTRWDMRLPMVDATRSALDLALADATGPLGQAFEALAGGPDAELWELGIIAAEPGAAMQPVHFDAPARCLFSAFIALQDVTQEMGPTIFLPGTNSPVAHRDLQADPADVVRNNRRTFALLEAGDAALYDSRVLHCGGENRSEARRFLMYMTFRDPHVDVAAAGIDQHSIRPELSGRFRLRDFRHAR